VNLSRDADLVIHDAQYSPEDLQKKRGWGHSSWEQAVTVARRAGVKKLALFHHNPDYDDGTLLDMKAQCQKSFPDSFFAREGTGIVL